MSAPLHDPLSDLGVRLLLNDLRLLEARMRDDGFARELYRALAAREWEKDGETVEPDVRRARELVNEARPGSPLALGHRFHDGAVDEGVRTELERLGWRLRSAPVESEPQDA